MSETTPDAIHAAEAAALEEAARQFDLQRMRQIGAYHFAMVSGAITLWGAAVAWADVTGWGLAQLAAVANALVAGFVVPSVIHEWGHFTGARLSGAVSPVLEKPRNHYFMFDFKMDQNDTRQFIWMSWGGILAPWLPVLAVLFFVPTGLLSAQVLLATLIFRAVSVAGFEVPVVRCVAEGADPAEALGKRVAAQGLPRSRNVGAAVGIACFALLWLAA